MVFVARERRDHAGTHGCARFGGDEWKADRRYSIQPRALLQRRGEFNKLEKKAHEEVINSAETLVTRGAPKVLALRRGVIQTIEHKHLAFPEPGCCV